MRAIVLVSIPLALAGLTWQTRADDVGKKAIKVVAPFNGRDLSNWKFRGNAKNSKWIVGRARMDEKRPRFLIASALNPAQDGGPGAWEMVNNIQEKEHSVDIYSEEKFGDCIIDVELLIPQGSNSGVYVMGEYEVQVLDSYGKTKVGPGDMGGLYGASAPRVNACGKPGEWQHFTIDFTAPRFKDGKKISNAKFNRVLLNDQIIHENIEMKGVTPTGVTGKEVPEGPIMFQGDHGPVSYRNLRILTW